MALFVQSSFALGSTEPNFVRDQFKTMADMQGVDPRSMDDGHISYCVETQKHYKWSALSRSWEEVMKQGPQGNSGYTGNLDELEVVNNLEDGGETAALSAEQGRILRDTTPQIQTVGLSDLMVADDAGNVLLESVGGHITTKEFDSKTTKEQLSHISTNVGKLSTQIAQVSNSIPTKVNELENADFAIADEDDNSIFQIKEGHVVSQKFNSGATPSIASSADLDFAIADEQGNVFLESTQGHLRTKEFDSSNIKEVEVVNNLTSGGTSKALSAEMGKQLKSEIDGLVMGEVTLPNDILDVPLISSQQFYKETNGRDGNGLKCCCGQQENIVGSLITGIRIELARGGQLLIEKISNFSTNPELTEITKVAVKAGVNDIIFSSPIKLAYDERISVQGSGGTIYAVSPTLDPANCIGYYYYSNNKWNWTSTKEIVIAILGRDNLDLYKNIQTAHTQATTCINEKFLFRDKGYAHFFLSNVGSLDSTIPSQSLADINVCARLGFKYIEANVHKTSDGKFVCIHGSSGKFGTQVKHKDGSDISTVSIGSVTLDWIKENVRYVSKYEKYRTSIPSLEEFLVECRKHNMSLMADTSTGAYPLIKSYVGDNFIRYTGTRSDGFTGLIMHYSSETDIAEIIKTCDRIKPPFLFAVTPQAYTTIRDAGKFPELVAALHTRHCMLGIAGCYMSLSQNIEFFSNGGDASATGWFVNEFETGNLLNLKGDLDYSDFSTTNTEVVDGNLRFGTGGGTISSPPSEKTVFLGKGYITIRFKGTLRIIAFGHTNNSGRQLTATELTTMSFSTYYHQQIPSFEIEGEQGTIISMIDFKASKC